MRVAIMQPYFLPYIGYFQLIASADVFVLYDNIKYTKKGWINRNRFLLNGADAVFSLPLEKASDNLDVMDRVLAADFDCDKLLGRLSGAYQRAPQYAETFPLLERIVRHPDRNLFGFIHHSVRAVCAHLGLATEIRISSSLGIARELKGQDKVLAICATLGTRQYINPIGGVELYANDDFAARGIELQFLRPRFLEYVQFNQPFVPWLSILDVLMFNSVAAVRTSLAPHQYELVSA